MRQKGCELAFIAEMTEISETKLERFFATWQRFMNF